MRLSGFPKADNKDLGGSNTQMPKVAPNYQKVSGNASLPITNKFPTKVNTEGSSRGEKSLAQNEAYLNEKTNTESKNNNAENGEQQLRMPEIYRESENNSQMSKNSMLPELKTEGNQAVSADVTGEQQRNDESSAKKIQTHSGFKGERIIEEN